MSETAEGAKIVQAYRDHRPYLIDLAFRMLGDIGAAEDAVQDAFTRLLAADIDEISDERGWLIVVTSRLCLDRIRSARARRERPHDAAGIEFVAPPARDALANPADRVTLDDGVSLALLVVLQRLSPAERVVFVLHDIFGMPFPAVARTVGRTAPACRQLAKRARQKIAEGQPGQGLVTAERGLGSSGGSGGSPSRAGPRGSRGSPAQVGPRGSRGSPAQAGPRGSRGSPAQAGPRGFGGGLPPPAGRARFDVAAAEHRAVTEKFIAACANGDLDGLIAVLAPDVWGDIDLGPGGPVRGVVRGAAVVARNLLRFWGGATLVSQPLAGQPALLGFRDRDLAGVLVLGMRGDVIESVHVIADPAKLAALGLQLSARI